MGDRRWREPAQLTRRGCVICGTRPSPPRCRSSSRQRGGRTPKAGGWLLDGHTWNQYATSTATRVEGTPLTDEPRVLLTVDAAAERDRGIGL